jgi:hypothetical protein
MADHFYGVTVPGGPQGIGNVTKGTSTNSANVELRVHDGVTGLTKVEVLAALEAIADYLTTDNAPA